MKKLTHESLTVYQRSIDFVVWASKICKAYEGVTGEIRSQFQRAFISIPLNIAEGSGRQTGKDQARFYDNARGSALECAACLDVMVATEILLPATIEDGKSLLVEIVAMLTALARSVASDRVHEDCNSYDQS